MGRESHSKFKLLHALSQIILKVNSHLEWMFVFSVLSSKYMQNPVGPENLCFEKWVAA